MKHCLSLLRSTEMNNTFKTIFSNQGEFLQEAKLDTKSRDGVKSQNIEEIALVWIISLYLLIPASADP